MDEASGRRPLYKPELPELAIPEAQKPMRQNPNHKSQHTESLNSTRPEHRGMAPLHTAQKRRSHAGCGLLFSSNALLALQWKITHASHESCNFRSCGQMCTEKHSWAACSALVPAANRSDSAVYFGARTSFCWASVLSARLQLMSI